MKRRLACMLLLAVFVFGLVGCGGTSTNQAETTKAQVKQSTTAEKQETPSNPKGTIKLITAKDYYGQMKPYLEEFQAKYKDIKIEGEEVPNANIDSKINMAHASNQDYDIMFVNNTSFLQFTNANVLEPLDEYLKKSGIDLTKNYSPMLIQTAVIKGKTYGISTAPGCRVLAYNKKILKENNLEPPKTQDDILAISKKLFDKGYYGFVRSFDNPIAVAYIEGSFLMGNGAYIYSKDKNGKLVATCDSKEMIESVKWWQEMTKYMPKDVNFSGAQVREMFSKGKSVFYMFGPWEFKLLANMKYEEDYEIMLTPGKVKNASALGGWYLGLGSGSKSKDVSWFFLSTLLQDPQAIAKCTLTLPGDERVYEIPPFNTRGYSIFREQMKTAETPVPHSSQFNKAIDEFFQHFNKALVSGADAEKTMKECAEKIQALLDKE